MYLGEMLEKFIDLYTKYKILKTISEHSDYGWTKIRASVNLTDVAFTNRIRKLVQDGYLELIKSSKSGRKYEYIITDKGERFLKEFSKLEQDFENVWKLIKKIVESSNHI